MQEAVIPSAFGLPVYLMFSGTRALLDQHIRDCIEDRKATADRFNATSLKLDKLEDKLDRKFDEVAQRNDAQHRDNQRKIDEVSGANGKKIDKLTWVIGLASGGAAILAFLASDYGQGFLRLLEQHPGVHQP